MSASRSKSLAKRGAAGMERALLGKIVLTRLLEMPLPAYERMVFQIEAGRDFQHLGAALAIASLGDSPHAPPPCRGNLLGAVMLSGEPLAFRYSSPAFHRHYRIDEEILGRLASPAAPALTGRLRLINTRNRLTHDIVTCLLTVQERYLRGGDPLQLQPFPQAALSKRLRSLPGCAVVADTSRISRLLRDLSIALPSGETIPLRRLCPKLRDLQRTLVTHVIDRERAQLAEHASFTPLGDREIAGVIRREFAQRISQRTVAHIRAELGIPDHRERLRRAIYFAVTGDFSPLLPLSDRTLRSTPSGAGVYEIRSRKVIGLSTVIYIGSAVNLRKRLMDHLHGNGHNAQLHHYLRTGEARFRYRRVPEDWRRFEREMYDAFHATFGGAPAYNRISP